MFSKSALINLLTPFLWPNAQTLGNRVQGCFYGLLFQVALNHPRFKYDVNYNSICLQVNKRVYDKLIAKFEFHCPLPQTRISHKRRVWKVKIHQVYANRDFYAYYGNTAVDPDPSPVSRASLTVVKRGLFESDTFEMSTPIQSPAKCKVRSVI
jgi:hypothetical protein